MGTLAIHCKGCGKDLPADDVNIDTGLAKCRACHAVFEIRGQVEARSHRKREPVPMPRNMVVAEGPSSLTVVRKWGRGPAFFLLIFAVFWNSIVAVFVVAAASGVEFKNEGTGQPMNPAFIWLFLTPFILVGSGVAYTALAFLLNKTRISIEEGRVTVTNGPVKWRGNRDVDGRQISQLYCTEYEAYKQNNVPQYRMCVHAMMKDGGKIELLKGLEDPAQAFFLEDLMEKHLRIPNRHVHGEFRGSPV